ncbi:MAG: VCBS repeat-containing protein [Solirubrobacterales bacterium]|nr:VCBS repeat-containing protein [Solirubrobacterales bacterium]
MLAPRPVDPRRARGDAHGFEVGISEACPGGADSPPGAGCVQFLGQALGSFGPPAAYSAGDRPTSVAVGDLNGDGTHDLAVANFGSDDVSVLLGDGTGSFGPATSFPVGSAPSSVVIAKLNGDAHPDLAVAGAGASRSTFCSGTETAPLAPRRGSSPACCRSRSRRES